MIVVTVMYKNLKSQEPNLIYLFKTGIFYLFLDNDAKTVAPILNLKLTNLNQSTLKCRFPCSSYDKYSVLFKMHDLKIKIIETDNKIMYNLKDYNANVMIRDLLESIKSINIDTFSISDVFVLYFLQYLLYPYFTILLALVQEDQRPSW